MKAKNKYRKFERKYKRPEQAKKLYHMTIPRDQVLYSLYPYGIADLNGTEFIYSQGNKPEPSIKSLDENLVKHWAKDAPLPPSVLRRLEKNDYREQNSDDERRSYDPFYDKRDRYRVPTIVQHCRFYPDWDNHNRILEFCNTYGTFDTNEAESGDITCLSGQSVSSFIDMAGNVKRLARALLSPSHEEYNQISQDALYYTLNELLHGSEFQMSFNDGKPIPLGVYTNLRQAIGIYFCDALLSDTELGICEECGGFFEKEDSRQRYCSPAPGQLWSRCKVRRNKRIQRNKP